MSESKTTVKYEMFCMPKKPNKQYTNLVKGITEFLQNT